MKTLHNFFRADFSDSASFLLEQPLGPVTEDQAVSFAAIMGAQDPTEEGKGNWVPDGDGQYSTAKAEVIYVGKNHEDLPTNPLFSHVVGLRLPPCEEGIPRRAYLMFNAPAE